MNFRLLSETKKEEIILDIKKKANRIIKGMEASGSIRRVVAAVLVTAQVAAMGPVVYGETESVPVMVRAAEGASAGEKIAAKEGGVVRLGGAEIEIPAGALGKDTEIKITRLWRTEDTGEELKNVTAGGGGYRFEPAGTKFKVPVTIRMGYEAEISESAKEEMYTYYYDKEIKRWEKLERVRVEGRVVVSETTHFTDMINGTLSLPEGPAPLRFNINSIKGLEAANAGAGVPQIEGLEGNNTGSGSFSIGIEVPPGRAGMAPQVGITYTSEGGNGIMGRGFELQAGGRISTDTRWGIPRYNGKELNTGHLEKDTYLLDGVKLKEKGRNGQVIEYEVMKESKNEKIERVQSDGLGNVDYWVVTDKRGTRRTYGRSGSCWGGKDSGHKYVWELEEERDIFGNTIKYEYENGSGQIYLRRIRYSGNEKRANADGYSIEFEYAAGRKDVRVDGRGGYVSETDRLLSWISVRYRGGEVSRYKMEYESNTFGATQMVRFGQMTLGGVAYRWSYRFEYERLTGGLFGDAVEWKEIGNGLQVQIGTTSGGQGSLSAGVGVGPPSGIIDGRVNGGDTFGSNSGETTTKQTFIDITGNGRPDSVRVTSGGVEVLENTVGKFTKVDVKGLEGLKNLGKEKSGGNSHGWNVGTGIGNEIFGAEVTYAETEQSGWSEAEIGFADMDGDGLVDIIVSGETYYYHNVSKGGKVEFEKKDIKTLGSVQVPANAVNEIDAGRKAGLDGAYYTESPLREWRAPAKGRIRVKQEVRAAGTSVSSDGIAARTYRDKENGETEKIRETEINNGRISASSEDVIEIGTERSMYFISDGREDSRGDDIEWGIKIGYERMEYFGDMDRQIKYVPPENFSKTRAEIEADILKPLYDFDSPYDSYGKLSERDWEREFTDSDKVRKRAAWEEIVRRGWFVPGYIAGEDFKALWKKAGELDSYFKLFRQVLTYYYGYHAGEDAYLRKNEERALIYEYTWKEIERIISALIQVVHEEDALYYRKLAGYEWGTGGREVYPVPGKNGVYQGISTRERISKREERRPGYIYRVAGGRLMLVVDVIGGREWSVPFDDVDVECKIFSQKVEVEATEPYSVTSGSTAYYIDGVLAGQAVFSKQGGKIKITIAHRYEGALQYETEYVFNNEDFMWISEELTREEIEMLRISKQGYQYTLGHMRWQGVLSYNQLRPVLDFYEGTEERGTFLEAFEKIPPMGKQVEDPEKPLYASNEECSYRQRSNLSGKDIEKINEILTRYGLHMFLRYEFPFYAEAGEGIYKYKDEAEYGRFCGKEPVEGLLKEKFSIGLGQFEDYHKLIEESIRCGFIHYEGELTREIWYYAHAIYAIEEGGAAIWELEADEEGRYGYVTRVVKNRRVNWDSGEDYSNGQRKPVSYKKTGTVENSVKEMDGDTKKKLKDLGITEAELKKVEKKTYEIEIGPERIELLYGGVNRWYYAIWHGNQGKKPFNRARLYEQNEQTASFSGSDDDIDDQKKKINDTKTSIGDGKEPDKSVAADISHVLVKSVEEALSATGGSVLTESESGIRMQKESPALVGNVSRLVKMDEDGNAEETTYFSYVNENRIHSGRAGGPAYYEMPGVMMPQTAILGVNSKMPLIRKSENEGTDKTWNVSANLNFLDKMEIEGFDTVEEVLKVVEVDTEVFSINAGYNHSDNEGESWMYQSVQSVSGSGMADIMQTDGNGIKVVTGSRNGFADTYRIEGIKDISRSENDSHSNVGSIGAGGSESKLYKADGKMKGTSINGGGGGSVSKGKSSQTAGFIDLNGDGLPDYVKGGRVTHMNLGRENWRSGLSGFSGMELNKGSSETIGFSVSIGAGTNGSLNGGVDNSSYTAAVNAGVSGGLNYSASIMQTGSMLIDMNGDGLPDQVSEKDGRWLVEYNLGNRFQNAVSFGVPGWNLGAGQIGNFSLRSDGNMMIGMFEDVPLIGNIINSTGLDKMFPDGVVFNPYGVIMGDYLKQIETNMNISVGLNVGANIGGNLKINTPYICLNVTLGGGGGFNMGANIGGVEMRLMDIDGDGLPDRVLRVPATDYLMVQKNLSGRVGLLRKIRLPQGGQYSLDYAWMAGDAKMPQSRYVLSEVVKSDGSGENGLYNPAYGSVHKYTVNYVYTDGYYDREQKEFYGFKFVTANIAESYNVSLGLTETEYYNDQYYRKGMSRSVTVKDGAGRRLRYSQYDTDAAPFARNIRELHETYELEQDTNGTVYGKSTYGYDAYGNVTRLEQEANGSEKITAEIRYWNNDSKYLHAHPREITVRGAVSGLLRKRSGEYNTETGALVRLVQMQGESLSPEDGASTIEWDAYGNIAKITDPGGAYVSYAYDEELYQYVKEITAGGRGIAAPYKSNIEWEYKWGKKKKETDENRQSIEYVYDEYGRLKEVWSPYDKGRTPAVRYRYEQPENRNWYAVTENKVQFDKDNNDTITTVVTLDGLGRALYTAKQGEVYVEGREKQGWNVGGITAYDHKGRSVASGQPLFVEKTSADALALWGMNDRQILVNATEQTYDSLDRVVKTQLPAAPLKTRPEQTNKYVIRENKTWTISTDPLGNVSEQGSDGRGNITQVRRLDKSGSELTKASYVYNGLGEMLEALDADRNPLTVEYDRLGRRTKLTSADIGTKQWWYDASGNVTAEADSELVKQGKRIQYEYDGLNRVVKINYPYSEATVYEYGEYREGGREDNAAGMVTKVKDETGSIEYKYGKLGQVEQETRIIKLLPLSSGKSKSAVMKYASDYLGRMQEITYPDGEVVRYGYGYGGQIKSVKGERKNTEFDYVTTIGYDEYGQRVYIKYGNGTESEYKYDPYRRWLAGLDTKNNAAGQVQDMKYTFDAVGNVMGYENNARGYTTKQDYSYDGLYQLTGVNGTSRSHPYGGGEEYRTTYKQDYSFNRVGNMMSKVSEESVSNTNRIGAELNYALDYNYYPGTHKAERIGTRYYDYDLNGNISVEREGGHAVTAEADRAYYNEGDRYWAEYGFGLVKPKAGDADDGVYQRNYRWNERNLLSETVDGTYTVQYRYGADGQRALKFTANSGRSTVYFNKMWQTSDARVDWVQSKHIYLNEDRIATKYNSEGNENTSAEKERTYYYHSDHLGSAQVVTNWRGQIHERLEYTPYGELWIDWKGGTALEDTTPFRFTGKEMDAETGFYYYGARYLDPKTSRWISADPALGDYVPAPGQEVGDLLGMGGVFNVVNMHVYHYAGNNPVKIIDPTGRDDLYYDANGQYVETIQSQTSDVYLRSGTGENTRITTTTEFNKFTAAVFGESSGNATESKAIAHVIMNRSQNPGRTRTISQIIDEPGQVIGYTQTNQAYADNNTTVNTNQNLLNARAGVIHAFTGTDTSNGAYFWEGLNFLTPGTSVYNPNNFYVRSGWGTTPGTAGIINFLETTRFGGTVFMRNNPAYHGNRRFP